MMYNPLNDNCLITSDCGIIISSCALLLPGRLHVYPENDHPIAAVDAEADVFVNMMLWFHNCLEAPHD